MRPQGRQRGQRTSNLLGQQGSECGLRPRVMELCILGRGALALVYIFINVTLPAGEGLPEAGAQAAVWREDHGSRMRVRMVASAMVATPGQTERVL